MTERIIIQDEISITQEEFDKVLEHYKGISDGYGIGMLGKMLNKADIIKEIEELTDIGKALILTRYEYEKWRQENEKNI